MKLSIITVCYNEEINITKTLESITTQKFCDYQFVIVDGASTDNTLKIIKEKFSDFVDVLISEPDTGIYNAMNKGLKHSIGEYVLFLNAGDYFVNENVLVEVFRSKNNNEDILFGYLVTDKMKRFKSLKNVDLKNFLLTGTLPHQASFIKMSLFYRIGGFDETFTIAGDYEFFSRAILKFEASYRYIDLPISFFDRHGKAIGNPILREKEKLRVQSKIKNKKLYDYRKLILINIKKLFSMLKLQKR